jgi:3-(3-hydroxy-phenyl)propionate hydroxylase
MSYSPKSSTQFDVAVIGYGPTGATLANLLVLSGMSVVVIEREAAAYHLPRAVHFDDEVMRVFQTVNIADALSRKLHINPGMRFVDKSGSLLLDWPRPQEVGKHGWHSSYRLHQPDLEKLLRDQLELQPAALIMPNTILESLQETESGVTLNCQDRLNGSLMQIESRYVVGCDGARSKVRDIIESGMEDLGFKERWLVVDLILNHPMPDLGDHSIQYCDPERPITYCRGPANRRRWEVTLLSGETSEEMTRSERVWKLLSDWITPSDAVLERSAVYTFRSALAKVWRRGRIMIAGDAAHLTPPFMGQGMCTGIRDASNLAWKLASVIRGVSDPALLDTYQEERSPHARSYIKTAIKLGGLINTLDRSSAQSLTDGSSGPRMASITPSLGFANYPGLEPENSPLRGQIFGQVRLQNGLRVDDVVGYKPVLISRFSQLSGERTDIQVLKTCQEPAIQAILDDHNIDAVLIRPDRYVLATAKGQNEVNALFQIQLTHPQIHKHKS